MSLKTILLGAAAIGILAACSSEAPTETAETETVETVAAETPTYDAAAFYDTVSLRSSSPGGFAFSPDGSKVLISSDETGIYNAYTVDIETGEQTALTQSTVESVSASTFFPEDERILYMADNGGDELDHVFVREIDGTVTDLTDTENTKASFGGWSADGSTFYVITNERDPRFFDIYAYSADDYSREMIFENTEGYSPSGVSSDGAYIALGRERTSADSDVFLYDVASGETTLITEHEGNVAHYAYGFTPDSAGLVYATDEFGEFNQAWLYDIETGEKSELISADWDVSYVSFSPSGDYRVHGVNEDGRTTVEITTADGVDFPGLDIPQGQIGGVRFNDDETKIAFMLSSDTSPNNLMIVDLATGEAEQLTDTLNPEIEEDALVDAQIIRYPSFDGLEIPGIFYVPHDASAENPAPALVWVHGGPGGQSRAGYNPMIQHLVNHGYVVLAANNRGSSGYGKTFFHMDDRRHGDVDLQDIVYAEHWLAEQDYVNADQIGILGGSYGGYMVGAALAFEPDVFKVGVNIFGVMNWVRTLESIPPWWESFREALFDEMGDPATDGERHRAISPLFHADNIQAPLLVVQGANDPRVLQVESDEIVEAVRANGVPVEYVIFPDEGHGFSKRENRITASEAFLSFLDTYLKGEGAEAEEAPSEE